MVRLPAEAHTGQPWRIHEQAAGFGLVDVWALPTPGGPDDFSALVDLVTGFDPAQSSSRPTRALFALRDVLGRVLRLDPPPPPGGGGMPFTPLYRLDDEWAAEIVNRTVHGIIHLGWVRDGEAWRGQLAILVRTKGVLGSVYLAAIGPFRHLVVYPAIMRDLDRAWRTR